MKPPIERPYVLFVAEYIYFKVCEIKKSNPDFSKYYYDINESSNPISRTSPYPFYPNISFGSGSGIEIDNLGNIWTYSNSQGIHVLLENTSYWPDINGIRTSNSFLLSDEIRDIGFDMKNNLVYILNVPESISSYFVF